MEARKIYKEKTDVKWEERDDSVEEKWKRLKEMVQGAMVKRDVRTRKRKIGYKDWWDRSCTKKKRTIHRMYRRWKDRKTRKEEYIREKK